MGVKFVAWISLIKGRDILPSGLTVTLSIVNSGFPQTETLRTSSDPIRYNFSDNKCSSFDPRESNGAESAHQGLSRRFPSGMRVVECTLGFALFPLAATEGLPREEFGQSLRFLREAATAPWPLRVELKESPVAVQGIGWILP